MLSQTGIYALKAMGYIASQPEGTPVLSQTISKKTQIPQNFLSKILNRLVQGGIVLSTRGRGGGFVLAKPAAQIFLKDIIGLFMKLDDFQKCFLGNIRCDGSCGLHDRWKKIADQFDKLLDETTIDQLDKNMALNP
ncbi:MAG: Rrf2 family transcriptional regulator [Thermodesulfobacteriota bacterium]